MTTHLYNLLAGPSFIAAFIGGVFIFYALRINKDASVNFIRGGVLLISQFILLQLAAPDEQKMARERLKRILDRADVSITIDGKQLDTLATAELSQALKSVANRDAHHSHPMDEKFIQIFSKHDTVNLTIGQDSNDSTEYWIYVDKPTYEVNETGRIRTEFFLKNKSL